ncbi:MAG: TIM barrel protein [Akkermansiaceae bacterium]|nr:TIM barrel protein [Verrucomicrobiales bacterium]
MQHEAVVSAPLLASCRSVQQFAPNLFDNHMSNPYLLKNKTGINGLGAGVWNLGAGGDPFGGPTREAIPVLDRLPMLAEAGMSFYEAHDHEIPAVQAEQARKRAEEVGLRCAMYTPSFFADSLFKDGGMTANDGAVRRKALENAKLAVDTTCLLGAKVMVFWNGREGFDFVLAKNGRDAFKRLVEGFNAVGHYAKEKYGDAIRFALEPKPNEPRANMYLANVGEALYLISRLEAEIQPLFGLNPETAHSRIAGLDYLWDIEMCLEAGKLFHIHLNAQDGQRYDQDLPFGYTEPLKDLALLVVLQDAGYEGIICFDVKAPRVDDPENIKDVLTVSSQNLIWLWERALAVDRKKIEQFRAENRLTALSGYLTKCLYEK